MALPGARKASLSNAAFAPQLARLVSTVPAGADWLHELKWDGYRLVATMTNGRCRLWSRNAIEWTDKQPRIAKAIEALGIEQIALDGELIAGKGTQQDFNLLQAALSGQRKGQLSLAVFDLLHLEGVDLTEVPLVERKGLLSQVLATAPPDLSFSSHVQGHGAEAFEAAAKAGFEGIISKRASSVYRGGRGDEWRKVKHLPSDEFAVVGYTPGKGGRKGVGSLLLARPDPEHGWVYAGRVGTGFTDELLRQIDKSIGTLGGSTPTAHIPSTKASDLRAAKWFEPLFVAEVFLRGISEQGVLRQPSLKTLRLDKRPKDLLDSDRGKKRQR